MKRALTASLLVLIALTITGVAQESPLVEKHLMDIDAWVLSDTARIMAFIDSTNKVTMDALQNSKYWGPTERDLGFLLGIDYVGNPDIDNTGRLYYTMRITGEADALFYTDKAMGWPHQITPNNWSELGLTISGYAVHPSGDYLIVQVNKFGDEMHDLWYFNRDGEFRPLLEDRKVRFASVMYDRANPNQFYCGIDNRSEIRFGRYDLTTGKLDTVFFQPGPNYPLDYQDGKMLFVRYFSFSEMQVDMLDIASGTVTQLTDTVYLGGADFTADGKVLILTDALSAKDEFSKFCILDPARPKVFEEIYNPGKEVDGYNYNEMTGVVIAGMNFDGYSKLAAFKLTGEEVKVPDLGIGVLGGQYANEIAANDKGDVVYGFTSPTTPPNAYHFSLSEPVPRKIASIATFGFDFSDVQVEVIRYPSVDGWEIPALLYTPKDAKKDGSNPAIVNYHGGPAGQSRPYFQRNIAFALSQGFVVMYPNVRGSTGYGTAYEEADNLEQRLPSLMDCEKALDYLIDQGWSSPQKIAVWGASYGGYIVNWLATHAADKLACAVSIVGVSDPDHTIVNSNPVFVASWEREYGEVGGELNRKVSPIFYAEDVTKPILVTAGFNDPRVPPSDPRRFAYVLNKLGKPVWYYEETEAGHGSTFKSQVIRDYTSYYTFTMMHLLD